MNTMLALYRYIMALSTESLRKDDSDYFSIMVLKYSQSQIFICPSRYFCTFTKIESNIIPYGAGGALDKPLQVGLMLNCTFRKKGLEVLTSKVHLNVHLHV